MTEPRRDLAEIRRTDGTTDLVVVTWIESDANVTIATFPKGTTLGNGDTLMIVHRIETE
jgi:hypothetical protein